MDVINLADLYELAPLDWSGIRARLDAGIELAPGSGGLDRHTCWLSTINQDGSPHVTSLGALWVDGAFWFVTGAHSRKGRNLARDPRCSMSVATHEFDLVVEGTATQITDPEVIADMARRWADGGWPCRVDDTGQALTAEYSAPSAGPPPWHIYRLTARTATAVGTIGSGGATRWRF
ncbi:pyridoxamine 5'-phosphate oxidase family protein [Nocardia sp. NBC_00565]|uniref:pyridoxamine 5'-phosphate oxidase family protein n=1 Tax=Nocardia sp. NBC_00565 TaxID=2975993 RepID=UPI002E81488C|nr:pyridoxamine 5'-phosphate oxidase family protein [Nocardia sp. NBC_00565]WUC06226.1 pyridoxamine 5'-phosphate oxidase family protein [Nocardia sp. NBC_00565]